MTNQYDSHLYYFVCFVCLFAVLILFFLFVVDLPQFYAKETKMIILLFFNEKMVQRCGR